MNRNVSQPRDTLVMLLRESVSIGIWSIYFGTNLLARLDERDYIIRE